MSDDAPTPTPDEAPAASTPDKAPTASAPDETSPTPTPPTMRRICCVAAPRRAPSLADQLRAASVWAQILQGAEAARGAARRRPMASDEQARAEGDPLTPLMRALLQAADCLVSPAPIPRILLLAPLVPRVMAEGQAALEALLQGGWLTAPSPDTVLLTQRSRDFLAAHRSDEPIQAMVVQGLCVAASKLVEARDEATLRLVEPHLRAMAEAWLPRGDRYALALSLAMATFLDAFGGADEARVYLERAKALDAALGAAAKAKRPWWAWR